MIAALALLLQAGAVTVGDTVWIERAVGSVGGAILRPQAWTVGDLGQQLGPPVVLHGSEGAVVRYALVLWYPGEHVLTMPGPVVVRRDGSSDTLAAQSVRVRVTSVLPEGQRKPAIPPKPARDPVPLAERTLVPLVLFALAVLMAAAVAAFFWRRGQRPRSHRGPPRPVEGADPNRRVEQAFHDPATLRAWAAAGEYRVALDGWGWILAKRMAESRDLDETARIQKVEDAIADAVFSPKSARTFAELCRQAEQLVLE
jgi:hypothetical protein